MKMRARPILLASFLALATAAQATSQPRDAAPATRSPAAQFIDDASITANIKAKHAEDRTVRITAIGVETRHGIVQLSGFTPSITEKSRAEVIAWTIPGVRSVRNDIILIN